MVEVASERSTPRLQWQGVDGLSAAALDELVGPGAPFEVRRRPGPGRQPLAFVHRQENIPGVWAEAVAAAADRPFLATEERQWTYAEADAEIKAIAALLSARYGIRQGDRVGFLAANHPEYVLGLLAVHHLGAIVAGLNGWWTGPEIAFGVELARPRLLVGDEPRLSRIDPGGVPADLPIRSLAELVDEARAAALPPPDVDIDGDAPALILFTSGTTGRPKGAVLTHANYAHFARYSQFVAASGAALAGPVAGAPQPASIVTGPLFHVSGTNPLFAGIAVGAVNVLLPPGRWDPRRFVEATARYRVAAWGAVPTYFWRILRLPDLDHYDLSCLVKVGNGGGPVAEELLRLFAEHLPWVAVSNTLGMTESTGLGVNNAGAGIAEHPDSVGTPMFTMEAEVRDESRRALPEGEIGEICFRADSVFAGYWENPEATATAIDEEGWYHTGDYGRIVDGLVYMDSRLRDMILRGGENIYPIEIENRLVAHPAIAEAAVIGVPHPELGQEVMAVVVVRADATIDVDGVRKWAAGGLAGYKVPSYVRFRDSLPYTESGKVMKRTLEDEVAAG